MDGIGVKGIRLAFGLSQIQFSEKLGLSQGFISDVENGRRPVSQELRIRIAQVFGTGEDVMQAIARAKESEKLAL